MSESTPSSTPGDLWKEMPEARKIEAAEAFWRDPEGVEQQAEAMVLLAQRLKARPVFIQSLPVAKRARHLAHYHGMPEILAARLLVSYHLAHKRPMMAAFLDAVGVAHDQGLISTDLEGAVPAEKVAEGAKVLKSQYPPDEVRLYFATLLAQDPESWKALAEHLG
jgi:hypothetical protein